MTSSGCVLLGNSNSEHALLAVSCLIRNCPPLGEFFESHLESCGSARPGKFFVIHFQVLLG